MLESKKENDPKIVLKFIEKEIEVLATNNVDYVTLYFEKILHSFPFEKTIWEVYLTYCKRFGLENERVLKQACKCCFKHSKFWIELAFEKEKNKQSYDEILSVVNTALQQTQDENFKFSLLAHAVEAASRMLNYTKENERNQAFNLVTDVLSQAEQLNDTSKEIELNLKVAELCATKLKSEEKLKDVISYVTSISKENKVWSCFAVLARLVESSTLTRNVLRKAAELAEDKNYFLQELINYEKMHGTVELIEKAKAIGAQRKTTQENENNIIFVKNINTSIHEQDFENSIRSALSGFDITGVRLVRDKDGFSKGIGYVEFAKSSEALSGVGILNETEIKNCKLKAAISKPPKGDVNDRTVFLKNLPNTNEQVLEKCLSQFGTILEVRLVRDGKTGEMKDFGYAEFVDSESALRAIRKGSLEITGKIVSLSECLKPEKVRENRVSVVVNNLNFKTDEKSLEGFLLTHNVNKFDKVTISRNEEGNSKGFAFVDFPNEYDLDKLLSLSGKKLDYRPLSFTKKLLNQKRQRPETEKEVEIKRKDSIPKVKNEHFRQMLEKISKNRGNN